MRIIRRSIRACSWPAAALLLLLRLVERQLARALRLSLPRVLIVREVGIARHVATHGRAGARPRHAAQRMPGLRLELLGQVVFRPPAAPAVRISALAQRLLEPITLVLSKVGHRSPPWLIGDWADGMPL